MIEGLKKDSAEAGVQLCAAHEVEICIILVNWNSGADVIECLASLLNTGHKRMRIIVCDNASKDDSIEKVTSWCDGKLKLTAEKNEFSALVDSHREVHLPIVQLDATSGAHNGEDVLVTLIQTGANLGFAGGNNVGIRYGLEHYPQSNVFWLLNSDTVVEEGAVAALCARMAESDKPGMCGTKLRYYHFSKLIQALNGSRFNRWIGSSNCIANREEIAIEGNAKRADIERDTYFVSGASIAVSRDFLADIGLMDEHYFLYFEEADWAARNSNKYPIGYAEEAVVYHKEGGAIGSNSIQSKERSKLSEYFLNRSRILFTKKHSKIALPTVLAYCLFQALRSLGRGHGGKFKTILKAIFDGLLNRPLASPK